MKGIYIPHLCHHMTDEGWGQVIFSCSQSQLTCSPIYQANSTVLPRRGRGPTFLNVITGKGEGQLPCQLEVEELRGESIFLFTHHHTAEDGGSISYASLMP